jgi:hypothetical protein
METLLVKLRRDFPDIHFKVGPIFSWLPKDKTITYRTTSTDKQADMWALFHELGHAQLKHTYFVSDFELVSLEAEAWNKATYLANQYGYTIDSDHVQDCLDTYRDWLHQRSTCPVCGTISLQKDATTYSCYNCDAQWDVARTRHCRPYRRLQKK